MPKIPVDPVSVTPAWLSEVLEAHVRGCQMEQIGIGVGLLGRLYRAHLDGAPGVPATVVVKLPMLDRTVRNELCEPLDFYRREVRFYQAIGFANPLPPARAYFAAFDEATHDFVLVLEDLGRLRNANQLVGCSTEDAEILVDALVRHQAHWWNNERLASLDWLKAYDTPVFTEAIISNYKAAWPNFLVRVGSELPPAIRDYGERFLSLMPWFIEMFSRAPQTFLHGDLRLDQLFFAVGANDPPVTALDWQVTARGRGAYDLSYFVSQSLTADIRRSSEERLIQRYADRLAEHGIDYPRDQLLHDYRLTTAWCFIYPVMAEGRIEVVNERNIELNRAMLRRAATAIEDHDLLMVGPD